MHRPSPLEERQGVASVAAPVRAEPTSAQTPARREESRATWQPSSARTVVKVGGSLVSDASRLRAVLASLAGGAEGRAVIVPGGGVFADAVRGSQDELGYSDALAHRLAIDAMGRMAEVFAEIEPRLTVVRTVEDMVGRDGACLWDPAILREGHPDIPESWDVTSDSLALWLATALGAERCVLIKSAPCPVDALPDELARSGLVDRAFPGFARSFPGTIALRGPETSSHPQPRSEPRLRLTARHDGGDAACAVARDTAA